MHSLPEYRIKLKDCHVIYICENRKKQIDQHKENLNNSIKKFSEFKNNLQSKLTNKKTPRSEKLQFKEILEGDELK